MSETLNIGECVLCKCPSPTGSSHYTSCGGPLAELLHLRTQLANTREELHCVIENVAEALMPDSPKECREAEFYLDGMGACQIIRRKAALLAAAQSDHARFMQWMIENEPEAIKRFERQARALLAPASPKGAAPQASNDRRKEEQL